MASCCWPSCQMTPQDYSRISVLPGCPRASSPVLVWNGDYLSWNRDIVVFYYAEEMIADWSDPALYIELFVDRRHHLTLFLEHQLKVHVCHLLPHSTYVTPLHSTPLHSVIMCDILHVQPHGNLRDVIFTTLLELYLAEIGTCQAEDRPSKEKKALELMQRKNATYDIDHALGNT